MGPSGSQGWRNEREPKRNRLTAPDLAQEAADDRSRALEKKLALMQVRSALAHPCCSEVCGGHAMRLALPWSAALSPVGPPARSHPFTVEVDPRPTQRVVRASSKAQRKRRRHRQQPPRNGKVHSAHDDDAGVLGGGESLLVVR